MTAMLSLRVSRHFESFEDHLRLLAGMDQGEQASFLSQTLKDLDIIEEMASGMLSAWRRGDVDTLADILFKSFFVQLLEQ